MRSSAAAVAVLLLAGCLQNAPFADVFDKDEVSAKRLVDEAEDAAKAWKPDAALAGAFAFESRERPFGLDERLPQDPDVGNGKAVAWAFVFVSGGRQVNLVVNASGDVIVQDESDHDVDFQRPVGDWVDSDDALDAALKDERVERGVSTAKAVGVALGDNGTGAHWAIFSIGEGGFVALVDARTGDLVRVESFTMPSFGDWGSAWGWGDGEDGGGCDYGEMEQDDRTGSLSAVERTVDEEVEVPDGAMRVLVALTYTKRLPSDTVTLGFLDPEGAEVDADDEDGSEDTGGASYTAQYDADAEGAYVFRLALDEPAVASDYTLTFSVFGCT